MIQKLMTEQEAKEEAARENASQFIKQYPEYKGERLEICANGSVYVHGNCAYPLIIKGFTSYNEYMGL